jgi:Family of unknown function (DUF5985)
MSGNEINLFLWGALAMASFSAALLLLRFWRLSGERLFLFFSLGFGLLSLNWIVLAITQPTVETRHYVYLLRLLAFALIIAGIVDKNRRPRHD